MIVYLYQVGGGEMLKGKCQGKDLPRTLWYTVCSHTIRLRFRPDWKLSKLCAQDLENLL